MVSVVYRFAVATSARTSLEWRIWTGSRKPSQDLYIGPRAAAHPLKVSVHKDGYCQLGFVPEARNTLREEDRQALSKWTLPRTSGWALAYQLVFPSDELQPGQPSSTVSLLNSAPPAHATSVLVFLAGIDGLEPPPGDWVFNTQLARLSGSIFIGVAERPFDVSVLRPDTGGHVWQLPSAATHDDGYAHLFTIDEDLLCHTMIEYSKSAHPRVNELKVPGFSGPVKPWSLADEELRSDILTQVGGRHFCAVFEHTQRGPAVLYVDEFARCNLTALGPKAANLAAQVSPISRRLGRVDVIIPVGPDHPLLEESDHAIAEIPGVDAVSARIFDGTTIRTIRRE